jgi:type II secretory pathway pseudopilin PulG
MFTPHPQPMKLSHFLWPLAALFLLSACEKRTSADAANGGSSDTPKSGAEAIRLLKELTRLTGTLKEREAAAYESATAGNLSTAADDLNAIALECENLAKGLPKFDLTKLESANAIVADEALVSFMKRSHQRWNNAKKAYGNNAPQSTAFADAQKRLAAAWQTYDGAWSKALTGGDGLEQLKEQLRRFAALGEKAAAVYESATSGDDAPFAEELNSIAAEYEKLAKEFPKVNLTQKEFHEALGADKPLGDQVIRAEQRFKNALKGYGSDTVKSKTFADAQKRLQTAMKTWERAGEKAFAGEDAFNEPSSNARRTQALVRTRQIKDAVAGYYTDYDNFPVTRIRGEDMTIASNDAEFIVNLSGKSDANPRGVNYLGDIPKQSGDSPDSNRLNDPWGHPFQVRMDTDYDEQLANPNPGADAAKKIIRGKVIVWSAGPDGKLDTWEDNITSWDAK